MTAIERAVFNALTASCDSATEDDAFLFMAALAEEGYEVVNRIGFIPRNTDSRGR